MIDNWKDGAVGVSMSDTTGSANTEHDLRARFLKAELKTPLQKVSVKV